MQEKYEVAQNGVNVKYNADKIKKGRAVGNPTLRGNFDELSKEDLLKLIGGEEKVKDLIIRTLSSRAHEIFTDCFDSETGDFDEETWKQLAAGMSVAGETLQDLRDRDSEISSEVMALVTSGKPLEEVVPRITELKEESRSVKEAIAKKEAINEARVAKRKANEEAKKANAGKQPETAPTTA